MVICGEARQTSFGKVRISGEEACARCGKALDARKNTKGKVVAADTLRSGDKGYSRLLGFEGCGRFCRHVLVI